MSVEYINKFLAGILLSTGAANTFDDFKQIKPFFKEDSAGTFCFPLSFDSPNATGLTSGENITIQVRISHKMSVRLISFSVRFSLTAAMARYFKYVLAAYYVISTY